VPPDCLTDPVALTVRTEGFLAAVLETAAQPIRVVDRGGVPRFANPAAITTLGYDSAHKLLGPHRHDTIHEGVQWCGCVGREPHVPARDGTRPRGLHMRQRRGGTEAGSR
jgi:PAS domain-containing protein